MAPKDGGPLNLLSLDGGGIRGVSELVMLDRIMRKVQERELLSEIPKPCDYFHLIGGVSTGGLVAILLGRLQLTTTEALKEYDSFAKKIFCTRNRRLSLVSRYGEEALEQAVHEVVQKCRSSPLMRDPSVDERATGKAFVCAMPKQNQGVPRRIRSYNSGDDWDKNITIVQAARATSAAPTFFKPLVIENEGVKEELIDAAMGVNNPVAEVLDEAGMQFDNSCKLGCFLSLGTGTRPKNMESTSAIGQLVDVGKLMKEVTTDSEARKKDMDRKFTDHESTYFRFSVPDAASKVKMEAYQDIPKLKAMTEEYLETAKAKADIEKVVDVLVNNKTENVTIGQACKILRVQVRESQPRGTVSRYFTGRKETLDKMSGYFFQSEDASKRSRSLEFLIWGMGGAGKSQVALKFYEDHKDRFKHKFWVDATAPYTLKEGYQNIGLELWPQEAVANDALVLRVIKWMETLKDDWLLILDNVDHQDGDWTNYLPRSGHAHVIFTSRKKDVRPGLRSANIAEVNELSEDNAVTLLLRAADKDHDDQSMKIAALPIARELGCLPLALDQAGTYLGQTGESLGRYLQEFQERRIERMKKVTHKTEGRNEAVFTTFDISFDQIKAWARNKEGHIRAQQARSAIKILNIICFYYHENLSEEIFRRAAEFRSQRGFDPLRDGSHSVQELITVDNTQKWNDRALRDGMLLLESFSLLKPCRQPRGPGAETAPRSYSMHVLIHGWARDRLSKAEQKVYPLWARTLLIASIPTSKTSPAAVKYRRQVLPHAMACETLVKEREGDRELEMFIQTKLAMMAQEGNDWEKAEGIWIDAIRDFNMEHAGTNHNESTISAMKSLAELYGDLGRFGEAERLLVEARDRRVVEIKDLWQQLLNEHEAKKKGEKGEKNGEKKKNGKKEEANGEEEGEFFNYFALGSEEMELCLNADDTIIKIDEALAKLYQTMGRLSDAVNLLLQIMKSRKWNGSPEHLKKLDADVELAQALFKKNDEMDIKFNEEVARQMADPERTHRFLKYESLCRPQPKKIATAEDEKDNAAAAAAAAAQPLSPQAPVEEEPPHIPDALRKDEAKLWAYYDNAVDFHGANSEKACNIMRALAGNMLAQQRPECARIIVSEVHKRTMERLGPHHYRVSEQVSEMAHIFIQNGDIPSAVTALMVPAINICDTLGVESYNSRRIMVMLHDLLDVYEQQQNVNKEQEEEDMWERLLALTKNYCNTWCQHHDMHRELRRRLGPSQDALMAARLSQYRSKKAWQIREARRELFKELLVRPGPFYEELRESVGLGTGLEQGPRSD
ncbi:hypothetical protein B0T13DRAFT_473749 [Neurospora crassa]|nr:hypothetical protein B0T13DRAFT_473749 [Neurospora crassa]